MVTLIRESGGLGDLVASRESLFIREQQAVDYFTIVCILLSNVFYIYDIAADSYKLVLFYELGDWNYFTLTLVFIALPAVIMTAISFYWYLTDIRLQNGQEHPTSPIFVRDAPVTVAKAVWFVRFVCLILPLSPVIRNFEAIYYGIRSRKTKDQAYVNYTLREDKNATQLRLFEGFMEAAPQFVLQLYIFIKATFSEGTSHWEILLYEVVPLIVTAFSVSWGVTSYQRASRVFYQHKVEMGWRATTIHYTAHLFSINARVLALGLFASVCPRLVFAVCIVHGSIFFAWNFHTLTFKQKRLKVLHVNDYMDAIVFAVVHIFTYVSVAEGSTDIHYAFYYAICFVENTTLLIAWYQSSDPELWYRTLAFYAHYVAFFIGVFLLVVYYKYAHPNRLSASVDKCGFWKKWCCFPKRQTSTLLTRQISTVLSLRTNQGSSFENGVAWFGNDSYETVRESDGD